MPQINQQQSSGNGNHQMSNHEQEQEHGALIIDQADEVILEEEYETATKLEQGVNDQEWQPAVQCPLCNEFFENKAAVKLHRYQVVMKKKHHFSTILVRDGPCAKSSKTRPADQHSAQGILLFPLRPAFPNPRRTAYSRERSKFSESAILKNRDIETITPFSPVKNNTETCRYILLLQFIFINNRFIRNDQTQ